MLDVCSQGNGTKTCDPWAAKEFDAKMTEAQSKVSNLCSHCLPDCNQIVYSSSVSSAKFRFETVFLKSFEIFFLPSAAVTLET